MTQLGVEKGGAFANGMQLRVDGCGHVKWYDYQN